MKRHAMAESGSCDTRLDSFMPKFLKVNINRNLGIYENIRYLPAIISLAARYKSKIFDDYFFESEQRLERHAEAGRVTPFNASFQDYESEQRLERHAKAGCIKSHFNSVPPDFAERIISLIERTSPYFWVLASKDKGFRGIVYLDDWTGSSSNPHCASVTTCIDPAFWGAFTKKAGKLFVKYVFSKYKLKKLKAEVYADNKNAVTLLKKIGFKFEASLACETIIRSKPVNINIYSIINPLCVDKTGQQPPIPDGKNRIFKREAGYGAEQVIPD